MAEKLADFGIITPHEMRTNPEMRGVSERILLADDTDEADLQIKYETLLALYKVKRLLFWVLVVVPAVLVGLGIVSYLTTVR